MDVTLYQVLTRLSIPEATEAKDRLDDAIRVAKWFCDPAPTSSLHRFADALEMGYDDLRNMIASTVRKEFAKHARTRRDSLFASSGGDQPSHLQ